MINRETEVQIPGSDSVTFRYQPVFNDEGEEVYRAGQIVPAGSYVEVDGWRQITLEAPGMLPATLDGRRAEYRRYFNPWLQDIAGGK